MNYSSNRFETLDLLHTLKQLCSFLGAFNMYRRFLRGFVKADRPRKNMLRKDADMSYFENPKQEKLEWF